MMKLSQPARAELSLVYFQNEGSLLMWLIRSESTCCVPAMALDTSTIVLSCQPSFEVDAVITMRKRDLGDVR